jgi:peptide chain release factor 2
MAGPGFWDDPERAQKVVKEMSALKGPVEAVTRLSRRLEDLKVLVELGAEEHDESLEAEAVEEAASLSRELEAMELRVLLGGKYDRRNAILSLHAGAGGTESQDWVSMLLRMYSRWAERRDFRVEILDLLPGEEAGIKSVTFSLAGEYAYGYAHAEKGVHRLVRISPFDAASRRHTSFASLDVMPEIEDEEEVDIKPEELKIDTFRSQGAGGQNVNKVETAVRITHLPTGIVVACQTERSQHANRLRAMRVLKAKLLELKEEERERELAAIRGKHQAIAWGSQIRSYVFQPYTLVKDHRTGHETGNVQAVMDGDLDPFISAYLKAKAAGTLGDHRNGDRRGEEA